MQFEIAKPRKLSTNEIEAEIIHIDHFGNLIINLKREDLLENFVIKVTEKQIAKHLKYYAEAEKGEILSIFGSAGFLEIVAFQDSANVLLNVKIGDKIFVTRGAN